MNQLKRITPAEIMSTLEQVLSTESQNSVVVAISGIDGSGKTTLAQCLYSSMSDVGHNAVLVNLDDWHHRAEIRFNKDNWAGNYYENAYRFDELFHELIAPLKYSKAVNLTLDLLDATSDVFRPRNFRIDGVDLVILEGIFLLKSLYRKYYDLAYWIECPYAVALNRVLKRNQEGLPKEQLLFMYNHIFFPAQRIHISRDNPMILADAIVELNEC